MAKSHTFDNQRRRFKQVTWLAATGEYQGQSLSEVYSARPDGTDTGAPYWTMKVLYDPTNGLIAEDIQIQHGNQAIPLFSRIEFTNVAVTIEKQKKRSGKWEAAGEQTFNIAATGPGFDGLLRTYENGYTDQSEKGLYQRGFDLVIEQSLKWDGQTPAVHLRCSTSITFRGMRNDIEPTGIVDGLYVYPEIAMKWTPSPEDAPSNIRFKVLDFHGAPKLTINVQHSHPDLPSPGAGNVASFYTDRNGPFVPLPHKLWEDIFPYYRPNVQKELEFTGVEADSLPYKLSGARAGPHRQVNVQWQQGNATKTTDFYKVRRQGAYDNVHIHGKMSAITGPGGSQTVNVHAPFCVHSCVHQHWRWGNEVALLGSINDLLIPTGEAIGQAVGEILEEIVDVLPGDASFQLPDPHPKKFYGWGRPPVQYGGIFGAPYVPGPLQSYSVQGDALIPVNQRLSIALTKPSTEPIPGTFTLVDPDQRSPQSLSITDDKSLWYSVKVERPKKNVNQVIFEHGCGYALRFHLASGKADSAAPTEGDMGIAAVFGTLGEIYGAGGEDPFAKKIASAHVTGNLTIGLLRREIAKLIGRLYPRMRYHNYPSVAEEPQFSQWNTVVPQVPEATQAMEDA
jgi:hypothetical protein